MAIATDHFGSLALAEEFLSQEFSIRDIKTNVHAISLILRKGAVTNTRSAAKEFIHLAVGELRKFDRTFKSRTQNSCGCALGRANLRIDYNRALEEVRAFLQWFGSNPECGVNAFLAFGEYGRVARLLAADEVLTTQAGAKLAEFKEAHTEIDCRKCGSIGDAIIALEQRHSWCLVHIDKDFSVLCEVQGRAHKQIPSLRAVEGKVT
jgi:hypothetical protein